jgi:hypothetical protein
MTPDKKKPGRKQKRSQSAVAKTFSIPLDIVNWINSEIEAGHDKSASALVVKALKKEIVRRKYD